MIFCPLGPQTTQPQCRILGDSLHHDDQITPFHRITFRIGIVFRYPEPSGLQTLDIHHHPAVFSVKQFHQSAAAADKDEHIAVAHVGAHPLLDHADQRVDSLAHICASGAQMIAHRIVKTEHDRTYFVSTLPSAQSRSPCRSGL